MAVHAEKIYIIAQVAHDIGPIFMPNIGRMSDLILDQSWR